VIGGETALADDHCQVTSPRAGFRVAMFLGGTGGVGGWGSLDPQHDFEWSSAGATFNANPPVLAGDKWQDTATFTPTGTGSHSISLHYGTASNTGGDIIVWQGDLDVEGLSPDHYTNPGLYLQIGGPRRKVTITTDFPGADRKSLTLTLNHRVQVWSAEEGGAAWAMLIDEQVHWCKAAAQPNAVVEFN
jgi:hypothetical protein